MIRPDDDDQISAQQKIPGNEPDLSGGLPGPVGGQNPDKGRTPRSCGSIVARIVSPSVRMSLYLVSIALVLVSLADAIWAVIDHAHPMRVAPMLLGMLLRGLGLFLGFWG